MRLHRRRLRPIILLSALSLACSKTPEPPPPSADEAPAKEETPAKEEAPEEPTKEQAPAPAAVPAPVGAPQALEDSAPIAELGEVVATAQIPTGTQMNDLAAFADWIQPNVSTLARMQAPKLLEEGAGMKLAGAKLDGPISLLVVDPSKHDSPVGLFVAVADSEKLAAAAEKAGRGYLEREGYALLGPKDVVEAAGEWAFANLLKAPDHSEFIVYPGPLMEAAGPMIEEGMRAANEQMAAQGTPGMSALLGAYEAGFRGLTSQTERIVLSVAAGQASSDINMHFYPKAGSQMEKFIAAQVPSDHALMKQLPPNEKAGFVMSGELHGGEAHAALVEFMGEVSGAMYKSELSAAQWSELMGTWLDVLDGRVAMAIDASSMAEGKPKMMISGLMGARDTESMRKVWRELIETFVKVSGASGTEMMGMGISAKFEPEARAHEDVAVDRYTTTLDISKLPEEQRAIIEEAGATTQAMEFAAFDNLGAMSSTEGGHSVDQLIDSARGKGGTFTPSAALTAVFADAQSHGESFIYFMDLASMVPPEQQQQMPVSSASASLGRLPSGALGFRVSLRK